MAYNDSTGRRKPPGPQDHTEAAGEARAPGPAAEDEAGGYWPGMPDYKTSTDGPARRPSAAGREETNGQAGSAGEGLRPADTDEHSQAPGGAAQYTWSRDELQPGSGHTGNGSPAASSDPASPQEPGQPPAGAVRPPAGPGTGAQEPVEPHAGNDLTGHYPAMDDGQPQDAAGSRYRAGHDRSAPGGSAQGEQEWTPAANGPASGGDEAGAPRSAAGNTPWPPAGASARRPAQGTGQQSVAPTGNYYQADYERPANTGARPPAPQGAGQPPAPTGNYQGGYQLPANAGARPPAPQGTGQPPASAGTGARPQNAQGTQQTPPNFQAGAPGYRPAGTGQRPQAGQGTGQPPAAAPGGTGQPPARDYRAGMPGGRPPAVRPSAAQPAAERPRVPSGQAWQGQVAPAARASNGYGYPPAGGTARRGPAAPPAPGARAKGRRLGCGGVLGAGLFALALALLVFGGLLFGYVAIASGLPSPEDLQARAAQFASTEIYDRNGQLLNEMSDPNLGRRTVVPLAQISKNLINATIATEDPNFYQHPGVDPVGLARAVYYAVREGDFGSAPGGSTITQQLVKLVYLTPEKSVTRKVKEAVLAAEITRRYSKDTVLQIYLNQIPYGNQAYGIEAASQTYFGKPAKDLDLAEASMLAGLPQAPSYYDPYTKMWDPGNQPGPVKQRQGIVLSLMVRHGYITADQADAAYKEPLNLKKVQEQYVLRAPHFVYYVRDNVEQVLGPALLAQGGLKIYTTLDPKIQAAAEQEVANQVKGLNAKGATDGALVAVRPATGEILAMVGSADFNNEQIAGQINMAVQPRQPGSSIKPLTYLTAFSMPAPKMDKDTQPSDQISALEPDGYWTPSTAILDISTQFPDGPGKPPYVPHNYDNKEHGIVTVRSALANSYNIPAVKALQHIGIDRLKDTAARLGITTLTRSDYGLSLTLGGGEVTLLQMTGAYATFANGGSRVPTSPIACIIDANGQVIWRGNGADAVQGCKSAPKPTAPLLVGPQAGQQVVDAQATYLITSILSDTEARRPAFGSAATLLSLPDRPAAAKTGTTNDNRDAWTIGYTPDLAVGVWVGNADYKAMQDVAGSIGAAPIWQNVMKTALQGVPPKQFTAPQGIQRMKVCADTGTQPSEACPAQREEVFAADRPPLPARFDMHQRLRIDKQTGQLATEFTPPDRVETKDLLIFPPRYQDWAAKHGYPQPNLAAQKYEFPPELTLNSPAQNSRVTGVVQVMGRTHLPQPLVWRLEYGVGPSPIGWGVVNGPKQGDVDGSVGDWDSAAMVKKHGANDFSLRLAAYDPGNMDYPVAVSNVVYVTVDAPTPTPAPTATPTNTPAPTATRQATATAAPSATTAPTALPTATAGPTNTPLPAATPQPIVAAITAPITNTQVSGTVRIVGVAAGTAFDSYQLSYAPGANPAPDAWLPVEPVQTRPTPLNGGELGRWNTGALTPGVYTLRLMVLDRGNTPHYDWVIVTVRAR